MQPSSKKSGVTWIGSRSDRGPEIALAIFGKHPGWDDHIDDLGLDTPRLVEVKRHLYADALAGNIDSGAWDNLDPAQVLASFGHELVWFAPAGLVVGRLWASRDGKGRTKYPMFVVAHCQGISPEGVTRIVLPRLAEIERLCLATTSAEDVRRVLGEARTELREAIKPERGEVSLLPLPELGAISDAVALGPERQGLHRVLYEIQRELGVPRGKSERKSVTRGVGVPVQHLRVPACAATTFESARLWSTLLSVQSDLVSQVLVLRALGGEFVDLIVGGVTTSTLFCLRASSKGLPLASDVPYTLEPEFIAQCEASVEAWRKGLAEPEDPGRGPPGTRPGSSAATSDGAGQGGDPGAGQRAERKRWFGFGGIGAAVLLVGAAGVYLATNKRAPAGSTAAVAPPTGAIAQNAAEPSAADEAKRIESERLKREAADQVAKRLAQQQTDTQDRLARERADAQAKADERTQSDAKLKADAEAETAAKKLVEQRRLDQEASDAAAAEKLRVAEEATRTAQERTEQEKARLLKESEAQRRATDEWIASGATIEALLENGYQLKESVGGTSVTELAAALAARPGYAAARDSIPSLRALAARVSVMNAIDSTQDQKSLVARAASAAPLAESLAAWDQLTSGNPGVWPTSNAELASAADVATALRASVARLKDQSRAKAINSSLDERASRIWLRAFGTALASGNEDAVGSVVSQMPALGIVPDRLTPRDRYNVLVSNFKRECGGIGEARADEPEKIAKFRAIMERFAADVKLLPGAFAERAEVAPTLAKLSALGAPAAAQTAPKPADMGPGLRGWSSRVKDADGVRSILFSPPAGVSSGPLEFVRVEASSGPVYLATTETTVGQCVAVVESAGRWGEVAGLLPAMSSLNDARAGARTWVWSGGTPNKFQPSSAGTGDTSGGWLPPSAGMQAQPYYPAGKVPEAPSAGSPMQQVTVAGAAYLATLFGCRLPTSEEWLAAAGDTKLVNSSVNSRDAAWKGEIDFVRAIQPSRKPGHPEDGIFWPAGKTKSRGLPATPANDGLIWFAPAASGDGVFKHLLGNVAEICVEQPVVFAGETTPESLVKSLGKGESARVVGGSALSPLEVDPKTPYPLESPSFGRVTYSDVGFRLAFSATGGAPAGERPVEPIRASSVVAGLRYVLTD